MQVSEIELNEEFKRALDLMENTRKHIFITGKAGTGKSTLLEYFRATTKKRIAVLAPTGIAAINVNGMTIHSFFKFRPDITLQKVKKVQGNAAKIYKNLDAIIIDEISMVRADLLDCVSRFIRLNGKKSTEPFGGIQMIFIGDLYQLPPVVTSKEEKIFSGRYQSAYFFDADVFKNLQIEFIELEKIYRQKDEKFINLLNNIRRNSVTEYDIELINNRVIAIPQQQNNEFVIWLTSLNETAYRINNEHLEKLTTKTYKWESYISGEVPPDTYPADRILIVKPGAQVMMLNNEKDRKWVNGTLGKITKIKYSEKLGCDVICVLLQDGNEEEVAPYKWEIFRYKYDENTRTIQTEVVGTFTQYPMRLAWAVTIHKSQGKTFKNVIIDTSKGMFAPGQFYVALSRSISYEGIILTKPIKKGYIFNDRRVVKFLTNFQYKKSNEKQLIKDKMKIIKEAITKKRSISIIYLKPNDEKSKRVVIPYEVGEFSYEGKSFIGVRGYCKIRQQERVFRVDRILKISAVE